MLVRIVRPIAGVIEGQPLSRFMPGLVYDVNPLLAFQLIEIDGAVEAPFADTADVVHEGDLEHMEGPMLGGVHVIQPDTTTERSSRRKRRR
ncbi:MAG: hypothetical protein ACRD3G_14840 [Vicinamibacterales bacterium]